MPIVSTSWLYRILAGALAIAALLWLVQSRNHWKATAELRQQQVVAEKAAAEQTVANYRAATEQARKADAANVARVTAEQTAINERTSDDYEKRIADARARAVSLRGQVSPARTDPGSSRTAAVPGVPASTGGPSEAAREGGLSGPDALTATEQAIQLDELIRWVKQQAGVRVSR